MRLLAERFAYGAMVCNRWGARVSRRVHPQDNYHFRLSFGRSTPQEWHWNREIHPLDLLTTGRVNALELSSV